MNVNTQIRETAQCGLSSKGWSQHELAKRAGIKQATVSRLLTGERQGEPETWQRLLNALGLELIAVPKGTDVDEILQKGP